MNYHCCCCCCCYCCCHSHVSSSSSLLVSSSCFVSPSVSSSCSSLCPWPVASDVAASNRFRIRSHVHAPLNMHGTSDHTLASASIRVCKCVMSIPHTSSETQVFLPSSLALLMPHFGGLSLTTEKYILFEPVKRFNYFYRVSTAIWKMEISAIICKSQLVQLNKKKLITNTCC